MRHTWQATYPRGTWPLFRCDVCGRQHVPRAQELGSSTPPAWFDADDCVKPKPMSLDDLQWLMGTGRYGQG